MSMEKLLEIGLSGWIIFILTILFGVIGVYNVVKRKTRQSNIKAGGDVAGGDISKKKGNVQNGNASTRKNTHSVQKNIEAKGDVAGGDIMKGDE